jgi:hypothetical protein
MTGTARRCTRPGTSRPPTAGSTASRSGTAPPGSRSLSGANDTVFGAIVYDAGEGEALHFGGSFTSALGTFSNRVVSLVAADSGGCNPADLAEPFGVLDLADIQSFVTAFTSGDPAADLAPPAGVLDLADLQAFVVAFTGGCP